MESYFRRLGTPLVLGGLLRYFRKDSVETYEIALCYAAGICVATAINVVSGNQAIFGAFHVGAKVRVAVCSLVYRKVGKPSDRASLVDVLLRKFNLPLNLATIKRNRKKQVGKGAMISSRWSWKFAIDDASRILESLTIQKNILNS